MFDAVGTLIYPNPRAEVVYYELGRQHGSRLTQNEIARNFARVLKRHAYKLRTNEQIERDRWRQIVADVFTDIDESEPLFRQLWNHFARSTSWAVYDDVPDVLAELHALGLITAIGSNFDDRLLAIAKELAPLNQTHAIFVSSQLGFTKPSIEFFRALEAELRLQPHQLLMVGDDVTNDIEGANQAGWHSLLLDRDKTEYAEGTSHSLGEITSSF
ncbi:MAG: HAD-IA family hydrolase [Planctomycetota bacterium]|nr:HAD-IA family hydrolase [Planctomycetota bacterium]